MQKYNPQKIEKKWQKYWEKNKVFKTKESADRTKYYILDMFPYPSGAGLHVGHPKGYIATDIVARMKMMQGHNVLHPMGWDAFGLPAENYALKNKLHPAVATAKNIKTFKKQLGLLGFTYDWSREINTTDPAYYRWTQWMFLQMYKRGLVYESNEPINWCPSCKTGLANEDLEDGKCERCGSVVEQKPLRQWVIKITDYAERLLNDIEKLTAWPEPIKEMQKNWIGKSEGALVKFAVIPSRAEESLSLEVFTTRPDTLFGCTYCVVSPEHKIIEDLRLKINNFTEVEKYIEAAKHKTVMERTDLAKEKIGVEIKGIKAVNPVNGEEVSVFVADYVLSNYGTGAIMAVPAHDERDWEFAKKYSLPMRQVVESTEECFVGDGVSVNSDFLNNLKTPEAKAKMIAWLEEKNLGKKQTQYKLRDWVFSRQRYWGEPIPLVKCEKCGWVPVPEDELPLDLPKVKHYEPSGTGESPLATIDKWVNTKCPHCGGPAKRETNTMPQWAGSCWYYLAYCLPHNKKGFTWDKDKLNYWMGSRLAPRSPSEAPGEGGVDFYVGGAEHATRHLIYARFWHKFLYDIGAVGYDEPFTRLQNVGLILAEDGRKMSKRWNNVINPDDVVKQYGADAMRLYEMFMGPFDQPCAWSTQGVVGMRRFLEKVWVLQEKIVNSKQTTVNSKLETILNQTIKKVTDDIGEMKFNTAISQLMILVNEMSGDMYHVTHNTYQIFLKILSPFAPHICEELWFALGNKTSITTESWPKYDPAKIQNSEITLAIQVNGKLRDTLTVPADISEDDAKKHALASEKIQKWLEGKAPKKVIYVKGRLVSIVV